MLRVILSHSRRGYSEFVWRQTTDNFIAAIENAFHHFGGVPKRLVFDYLKAAVNRADWYDPEIHPKFQSFAMHYGTVFVPTKAYTPEHKGKVEAGRLRTDCSHIPAEKVSTIERGTDALMRHIASIGPHTKAWSELVIATCGVQGVRVLVGLKSLAGKHPYSDLEQACETAVAYGACRLKSTRNLLKRKPKEKQMQLDFIEEHPIIRPLSDYSIESLNSFRKDRSSTSRKESP